MDTSTLTKAAMLTEYRVLAVERARLCAAGEHGQIVALAPRIGRVLGELRYTYHVPESELNAIRSAVIEGAPAVVLNADQSPVLPAWANGLFPHWSIPVAWQPVQMIRGGGLQPGDVVYFSQKASPRILRKLAGSGVWRVVTVADYNGFSTRIAGNATIEADRFYVVCRPVKTV